MKILFIGSTRRTALALNYFTNLVRLGHVVLPYDPDVFFTRNLAERIRTRIRKAPPPQRVKQVNDELVSLCVRNHFDLVFTLAENYLSPHFLEEVRAKTQTPPVFVYHSHDNNFAKGILKPDNFFETLKRFDFVFTTKSQNVQKYRDLGQHNSFFLASAYEPAIHHPIQDRHSRFSGRTFDVTFIGTYDKSRVPVIETVGWEHLHVWGDRWKRYPHFKQHRNQIHTQPIYDFEFADVTSHSKCALGLLREEASDLHTTRTFEIPACGAFQLAPRNEEILSFFEENKEIVCFSSPDELKDKVNFYLNHDFQRNQIARKGYERCLRDKHTYLDRVKEILSKVKVRPLLTMNVG